MMSGRLLTSGFAPEVSVGASGQEIPFPYVLDASDGSDMGRVTPLELARHFPTTELADIGDELADGLFGSEANARLQAAQNGEQDHRLKLHYSQLR